METTMQVCEACPKETKELKLITLKNQRKMNLCPSCYQSAQISQLTGKEFPISEKELVKELDKKEEKVVESAEVTHYLQNSISRVSNPDEVPTPDNPKRKITQAQLFAEISNDENFRIEKLDFTKDGYKLLEDRIALIEAIAFEAKTRAAVLHSKKRKIDAASGKNRWDDHRGKENKSNSSDPRNSPILKTAKEKHKKELSKIDKVVSGFIELGYTDDEIMDAIPEGKFKGHEIRESIASMRK
jgi:hypothetical protein